MSKSTFARTALFFLALLPVLAYGLTASESKMLERAKPYLPALQAKIDKFWPDLMIQSALAAQVEKESLWNPRARLKTEREEGVGFGQLTRTWRADGTIRFDVFSEAKALDASLEGWRWEDRFDPDRQLSALVLKDRQCHTLIKGIKNHVDHMAFALACYNGGLGGVFSDQRICSATKGCDPGRWFGHVERTSNKSRVKWKGYGDSAFDINRKYPKSILFEYRPKYDAYFRVNTM